MNQTHMGNQCGLRVTFSIVVVGDSTPASVFLSNSKLVIHAFG